MYDVLTLAALVDEINASMVNGRLQKVGLVDRVTLAAEIYTPGQRRWLVASAESSRPRLFVSPSPVSTDPELITPFGLLMRKYVRGGILVGAEQEPLERVVRLSIAKRLPTANARRRGDTAVEPEPVDGAGDEEDVLDELDRDDIVYLQLVVEIMGRHSNILLVDDDGTVMEAVKHVTPAMSRVRPIYPRMPYVPPPPIDRPDPRRATTEAVATALADGPDRDQIARRLVSRFRAVSPQVASETVFRATGSAMTTIDAAPDAAELARHLRGAFEPLLTGRWEPATYARDGEIVAFSPIRLQFLDPDAERTDHADMMAAIAAAEAGQGSGQRTPLTHVQRRERLLRQIAAARDRIDARIGSLEAQEAQARDIETFREWGELIYAWIWKIRPGDAELVLDDVTIPLDPGLTAAENAAEYFQKYRKAQGAGRHLPALQETAASQLAYLEQLAIMVRQASGFAEIEALATEWDAFAETAGIRPPGERSARKAHARHDRRPRPLYDGAGNAIYIGRSGRQNDEVTFGIAGADDTWLHARGVPGSHVIIRWRRGSEADDDEVIGPAASLAAWYSGSRESTSVEVDVTQRRHVRKIKGAGPGMVTYRQERTVAVPPLDEKALADRLSTVSPDSRIDQFHDKVTADGS